MKHSESERDLFAARAARQASLGTMAPPPFASVLAEVRRERRGRERQAMLRRRAPFVAVVALVAAAATVTIGLFARRGAGVVAIDAEPPPTFACYDDPRSLVVEATAYATDRAIASAEDRYAACLVATPRGAPAGGACATVVETDVTCTSAGPLDDEIFESRVRGGSIQ